MYLLKLMFDKFEGADFKYDKSFQKFQPKNTQINHLGPKLKDLYFHCNFVTYRFVGADSDNSTFQFQPKNTQKNDFES